MLKCTLPPKKKRKKTILISVLPRAFQQVLLSNLIYSTDPQNRKWHGLWNFFWQVCGPFGWTISTSTCVPAYRSMPTTAAPSTLLQGLWLSQQPPHPWPQTWTSQSSRMRQTCPLIVCQNRTATPLAVRKVWSVFSIDFFCFFVDTDKWNKQKRVDNKWLTV